MSETAPIMPVANQPETNSAESLLEERISLDSGMPERPLFSAEVIPMYAISGHEMVVQKDLKRYLKCKNQDDLIGRAVITAAEAKTAGDTGDPIYQMSRFRRETSGLSDETKLEVISGALSDEDIEFRIEAIQALFSMDDSPQAFALRLEAINNPDTYVSISAMHAAIRTLNWESDSLQDKEFEQKVMEKLYSSIETMDSESVWRFGGCMDYRIPAKIKAGIKTKLTERTLLDMKNDNPDVRFNALNRFAYIEGASEYPIIREGISDIDPKVRLRAAALVSRLPEGEEQMNAYAELRRSFESHIEDSNVSERSCAVDLIALLHQKDRNQAFLKAREVMPERLIASRIYNNKNINSEQFSRTNFDKTDSKTTLIGGRLKDKIIVREIEPQAFVAWQKAYENFEGWQKLGFDYVPIEPIAVYALNKDGQVDVMSGLLDLSYKDFLDRSVDDPYGLEEVRKKIIDGLEAMGVKHGHDHTANFCLRFFRNEDGSIDFDRKPRMYAIDFDLAKSQPENV